MPYISKNNNRREMLKLGDRAETAGELNYQIFYYVKHAKHIRARPIILFINQFLGSKPNYQRYNDMTGALVRCAKEIKRRLHKDADVLISIMEAYDDEIEKYENLKIIENGDVE